MFKSFVGWVLIGISIVLCIHSGMGVSQFKHWLSLKDEEIDDTLPLDIKLECISSLVIAIIALQMFLVPSFKEVTNIDEVQFKSYDGLSFTEDFITFNNRRNPHISSLN